MKVLHLAESTRGGCGTYLNELLRLQCESFGADNLCLVAPDRHLAQFVDVPKSVVRPFYRPGRAIGLGAFALTFLRAVRAFRPDVIHAHSTFAGAIARSISAVVPTLPPIIYCAHGWVFDTAKSDFVRRRLASAERILSRYCASIICISTAEQSAALAAGMRPDKLRVIANGIRLAAKPPKAAPWKDKRLKLLFVGRLDRQKGLSILLQAIASLHDRVCLRVIGESVVSGQRRFHNSDFIEYLGWQDADSVAAHMASCDLVVIPSLWEGFGLVAIEAMRVAKPVVASAVGGLPEIVQDGITGRLVRPGDPVALRGALLADDEQSRTLMGRSGLKAFQRKYTVQRTHSDISSLYSSVLRTKHQESRVPTDVPD